MLEELLELEDVLFAAAPLFLLTLRPFRLRRLTAIILPMVRTTMKENRI